MTSTTTTTVGAAIATDEAPTVDSQRLEGVAAACRNRIKKLIDPSRRRGTKIEAAVRALLRRVMKHG